jgi:hypothetical protein
LLVLDQPTVGLFSTLEVVLEPEHAIPKLGQIVLKMPKWNSKDPTPADYESMIAVSQQQTSIECKKG